MQGLLQPQMSEKIERATRRQFPQGIPALGTDALRFTYCALASPTRDIRFDLNRTEGYRNFCNKLWNASRFVLMHTTTENSRHTSNLSLPINCAFYSLLQDTIAEMHNHFKSYRFDLMAQAIYEFVWNQYCDWYVELAKPILMNSAHAEAQQETRACLVSILETCLCLLHPLMPFITEEIWQSIAPLAGKTGTSLMLQSYPKFDKNKKNLSAEQDLIWLKTIVHTIRAIRSEMNIAPGKKIPLFLYKGNEKDRENSRIFLNDIMNLAKISTITWAKEKITTSAMGVAGSLELLIPMEGLIDKEAETQRLEKEIMKINKEIERAKSKLANTSFVKNAPDDIILQEKKRLSDFTITHSKLQEQVAHLKKLKDI